MSFTEGQKIDIRRHCGLPVFGNGNTASPPALGYRYYKWYLNAEYRMNNLSVEEEAVVINVYLQNLNTLEAAIPTASDNLDTDRAAVWYHNKKEVEDRYQLYRLWCKRLVAFFDFEGIPKSMGFQVVI